MRYLLDTHALVWWLMDVNELGRRAHTTIAERSNEIFVSAVSAFEIARKNRLGKWPEVDQLVEHFDDLLAAERFTPLPFTMHHAIRAGQFRMTHRDPFDRILAAQAHAEDLTLITIDPAFAEFPIEILW
ncbi:type II toxin-antitoxin system VapC family toxin [Rhizobium sp. CC-YZS058]|uniref:type II toxin-antitoxin system VapC family toxin n=1 Tax=Rhizobium sp. CC-YZS058 TaxID=3042153 RepID=UPI002B0538BE|nr:type II toxin-antitoxin system VapC family toxin [Rhizobium sp. CC-YZS058]MEA3534824.1 type II toxin-antitoxin system VapC family toxin [Rhizobium sp. CC-YZS058]